MRVDGLLKMRATVLPARTSPAGRALPAGGVRQHQLDLGGGEIGHLDGSAGAGSAGSSPLRPSSLQEERSHPVDLLVRDDQRRQEAEGRVGGGVEQDARIQRGRRQPPSRLRRLRSTAAMRPRRRTSRADAGRPGAAARPRAARPRSSTRSKRPGSSRRSSTARAAPATTGAGAEGGAVVARTQDAGGPPAHDGRPHGQAARQALGHGDDVRLQPEALVGEGRAAAAQPGLHLVQR